MSREIQASDKLYDVQQAADVLKVNPGTIRRWAQAGTLKGMKVGVRGDWRFTDEELRKLFRSHKAEIIQERHDQSEPDRHPSVSLQTDRFHEVQFYNDEAYLIDTLQKYIGEGLEAGDVCIAIVTAQHAKMLEEKLRARGVDTKAAETTDRLIVLDAARTLKSFMKDGYPDPALFFDNVGKVIEDAAKRSGHVRAYGEMVALLWAAGNLTGMIKLEQMWNELAKTLKFSLLCGYSMAAFDTSQHGAVITDIGHQHGAAPLADELGNAESTSQYMRSIITLQHKAQALQHEIASREALVKKLETEARQLKSEQHRLRRLNRAKDEFISIASHQLRTPATGVKQYIGMLIEGYFGHLTADQMRCLQKAYDSNERQIKVVNDLLLIAKVDAGNIHLTSQESDLSELVTDVVEEQRDEISKHGQSISLLVPDKLLAHIDPQYMRMVLENLVSNASKYSPSDTSIDVTARRTGEHVLISVRDHGIGISAADQAKLYKKFSRIYNDQSVAEGNGLGLYWSKKIVELHHGQLLLESKPGQGSTFTIQLQATQ